MSLCLAAEAGNTTPDVDRRIQEPCRDEAQLLSPRPPRELRRAAESTLLQWQSRPRGGPGVLDDAPLEAPDSDPS